MNVTDFDYNLPEELIAQVPSAKRDECRLLVIHMKDGSDIHGRVNYPIGDFNNAFDWEMADRKFDLLTDMLDRSVQETLRDRLHHLDQISDISGLFNFGEEK